jgi:hypothetical protein
MRTTLTLDDDVALMLKRLQKTRNEPLRALVNDALRQGLARMNSAPKRRRLFRTDTVLLGRCLLGTLDNVAEALALAEGESFK